MANTREQIIELMVQATAYPSSIAGVPVIIVDNLMRDEAAKMLPVAVKAVTDRVREMAHIEDWLHTRHSPNEGEPECPGCWAADIHQLCDQIDAELGGER